MSAPISIDEIVKEYTNDEIEETDPFANIYKELNDDYVPDVVDETATHKLCFADDVTGQEKKEKAELDRTAFVETIHKTLRAQKEEIADNFESRFTEIKCWYVRVSWIKKLDFMLNILQENNSYDFLKLVLRLIAAGNSKDLIYSTSQKIAAFHYDVVPLDGDRALDNDVVHAAQLRARVWFTGRSVLYKVRIFINLLLMSGGALTRRVYIEAARLMKERQLNDMLIKALKSGGTIAKVAEKLNLTEEEALDLPLDFLLREQAAKKAEELAELKRKEQEEAEASANGKGKQKKGGNSSAKEKKKQALEEKKRVKLEAEEAARLEKERNKKKTYINELGEEVEIEEHPLEIAAREALATFEKKLENLRLAFGVDEYGNQYPPVTAKTAHGKTKKKEKKKAGDKKKKGGEAGTDTVDQIQLLPLSVNRAILALLKESDLKALKKVNRYWSNMVDDVNNERKARVMIEETIRKNSNLSGGNKPSSPSKKGGKKGGKKGSSKKGSSKSSKKGSSKGSKKGSKKDGQSTTKQSIGQIQYVESVGNLVEPPHDKEGVGRLLGVSQLESVHPSDIYHGKHAISSIINTFFHSRVMACDSESRLMAVTSPDNAVEFYSLLTGASQQPRLVGNGSVVTCMTFHHDGSHLVTGNSDATARLWNIWGQTTEKIYRGHEGPISCLALSGVYLATGAMDNTLKVFHVQSGHCQVTLVGRQTVTAVSLSSATKMVYVGHRRGEIRMYNYMTKALIANVFGHKREVTAFHLAPPLLASCGTDGFTRIWNCNQLTPSCLMCMNHSSPVQSIRLCHNRLMSGDAIGQLRVWCALTGELLKLVRVTPVKRPILHINCIEESDFAKIIVSCESQVKVYEFYPPPRPKTKPRPAKKPSLCTRLQKDNLIKMKKPLRGKMISGPGLISDGPVDLKVHREDRVTLRMAEQRKLCCVDPKITQPNFVGVATTESTIYTTIVKEHPDDFCAIASKFKAFPRAILQDPEMYILPMKPPQLPERDPNAPMKEDVPEKCGKPSIVHKPASTQKGLLEIYNVQKYSMD